MTVGSIVVLGQQREATPERREGAAGRQAWSRWASLPPRRRRWLAALAALYAVVLHAAVAGLVYWTSAHEPFETNAFSNMSRQEFGPLYERWARLLERIDARAAPGQVVFLGDSFVRELDTNAMAERTLNLAIEEETTERLLARIGGYRSVPAARGFVLGVGGSDVAYRSLEAALANYRDILAFLPDAAPVIMLAVLPVDQRIWPDYRNGFIPALNDGLRDLCEARPGCRFVDPTAKLVDETGNLAVSYHEDGWNLSKAGHEIVWRAVNSAVHRAMPPLPRG